GDLLVDAASMRREVAKDQNGRVIRERLHRDDEKRGRFIDALRSDDLPTWRSIPLDDLELAAEHAKMYVISFSDLPLSIVEQLDDRLKPDVGYLGALQVYLSDVVHWRLYDQGLILRYRLVGPNLRLLYYKSDGDDA